MRLYSFVNYYLSPLQHGLQTAHCVSEMSQCQHQAYVDWASEHKTIIICNGGNAAMLEALFQRLADFSVKFDLPLVKFHEDEQSLNNALTSVAIIVPEKFYDVKFEEPRYAMGSGYISSDKDGRCTWYNEGTPEFEFIALIKSFRLA